MHVGHLLGGLLVLVHLPGVLGHLDLKVRALHHAASVLRSEPFEVEAVAHFRGHLVDAAVTIGLLPFLLGHGEDLHLPRGGDVPDDALLHAAGCGHAALRLGMRIGEMKAAAGDVTPGITIKVEQEGSLMPDDFQTHLYSSSLGVVELTADDSLIKSPGHVEE
jgi:hypothetical protein